MFFRTNLTHRKTIDEFPPVGSTRSTQVNFLLLNLVTKFKHFNLGKSQKEKPSIIVSGADDGRVYLLRPQSWSEYIWHYETDVILLRKDSRIGIPAVADVDGDGNVEIFVPEKNFIHVLTYAGNFRNQIFASNFGYQISRNRTGAMPWQPMCAC